MLKLGADGILGFSQTPLKLMSRVGYVVSIVSLIGLVYALTVRLFFPQFAVEGWTFIMVAIFLMGGLQIIMLGLLGSYIGRIFTEVKGRPLYSIDYITPDLGDPTPQLDSIARC